MVGSGGVEGLLQLGHQVGGVRKRGGGGQRIGDEIDIES